MGSKWKWSYLKPFRYWSWTWPVALQRGGLRLTVRHRSPSSSHTQMHKLKMMVRTSTVWETQPALPEYSIYIQALYENSTLLSWSTLDTYVYLLLNSMATCLLLVIIMSQVCYCQQLYTQSERRHPFYSPLMPRLWMKLGELNSRVFKCIRTSTDCFVNFEVPFCRSAGSVYTCCIRILTFPFDVYS